MKRTGLLISFIVFFAGIYLLHALPPKYRTEAQRQKYMKMYPLPENNQKLKRVCFFPTDDQVDRNIFAKNPHDIAMDENGEVYVLDQAGHKILVFDSSGKFIRQFGQRGQGPSDLFLPISIVLWKDQVVVSETGNLRIQFMDKTGKYIKSFRTFRAYQTIVMDKSGLIYGVPVSLGRKKTIVDVLDQTGKLLNSFGKTSQYLSSSTTDCIQLCIDDKEAIYIARTVPAIIEKYSKKGKFLRQIKIKYPVIVAKTKIQETKNFPGIVPSITDFCVLGDRIFVSLFYPRLEIVELTMTGELKTVYWNTDFSSYLHFNLMVRPVKDKLEFYIARVLPEQMIDKFSY